MNKDAVAEISQPYQVETAQKRVPEGYKQTEVGVIPEDWGLQTIKEISLIPMQNGLFYEPKRKGTGVPLINVGDMYTSAPVDVNTLELFNATAAEIKTFKVHKGDVLFTRSSIVPSGIAYCNIFNTEQNNVVFDSHLIRVRPDENVVYPEYLYLNCIAEHARKALVAEAKTATMTTIDQGAINRCPVLLPPKIEQVAIVNALSDTDALLSELEKLIAKKQAIKTAIMQQLLTGRTRLPQFANHPDGSKKGYKQSELGEIPEDWEVVSLGEFLVNGQLGGNYSNSEIESEYPLIKMGNLNRGRIKLDKIEYSAIKPEEKDRLFYGDVLLNTRNTLELVGKVAIWRDEITKAYFNSNLMRLNFNKHLIGSGFFVNLLMNTDRFLNGLSGIAIGTTSVAAIYLRDLLTLKVVLPSKQEQTAIATILSDMDEEIQALEQRLNKTRQIKQGMMQELLTGKTRLVVPQD